MNWESNAVLDNHLRRRQIWEHKSRVTFYETDEEAHLLATFILEALADFTVTSSGNSWPKTTHGEYCVGAVASFIRTHFMVIQCC